MWEIKPIPPPENRCYLLCSKTLPPVARKFLHIFCHKDNFPFEYVIWRKFLEIKELQYMGMKKDIAKNVFLRSNHHASNTKKLQSLPIHHIPWQIPIYVVHSQKQCIRYKPILFSHLQFELSMISTVIDITNMWWLIKKQITSTSQSTSIARMLAFISFWILSMKSMEGLFFV